jgi:hypothetical protein
MVDVVWEQSRNVPAAKTYTLQLIDRFTRRDLIKAVT